MPIKYQNTDQLKSGVTWAFWVKVSVLISMTRRKGFDEKLCS